MGAIQTCPTDQLFNKPNYFTKFTLPNLSPKQFLPTIITKVVYVPTYTIQYLHDPSNHHPTPRNAIQQPLPIFRQFQNTTATHYDIHPSHTTYHATPFPQRNIKSSHQTYHHHQTSHEQNDHTKGSVCEYHQSQLQSYYPSGESETHHKPTPHQNLQTTTTYSHHQSYIQTTTLKQSKQESTTNQYSEPTIHEPCPQMSSLSDKQWTTHKILH